MCVWRTYSSEATAPADESSCLLRFSLRFARCLALLVSSLLSASLDGLLSVGKAGMFAANEANFFVARASGEGDLVARRLLETEAVFWGLFPAKESVDGGGGGLLARDGGGVIAG